jgi:ABC-type arginine/histidine transport system permease subunit
MMAFVMMTLSITVGLLLAMGLATMIMLHPKVMKWYMNYVIKSMNRFDNFIDLEKTEL